MNELYNNSVIRKSGSFNTNFDMLEEEQYINLYENNTDKTINMVYYCQTNSSSGEWAFGSLEISTDGGNTWNKIFDNWNLNTESGMYDLPTKTKVRLRIQKNACFNFYEIYFSKK